MAKRPAGAIRASDISRTLEFVVDVNAHASGDLLAQPMRLADVSFGDHYGPMTTLVSVSSFDADNQGVNFTVVFMKNNIESLGALNAAPVVTDQQWINAVLVGSVAISIWEDLGTASLGTVDNVGLMMESNSDGDVYAWLLSKGAGTYAGGKIRVTFNFARS